MNLKILLLSVLLFNALVVFADPNGQGNNGQGNNGQGNNGQGNNGQGNNGQGNNGQGSNNQGNNGQGQGNGHGNDDAEDTKDSVEDDNMDDDGKKKNNTKGNNDEDADDLINKLKDEESAAAKAEGSVARTFGIFGYVPTYRPPQLYCDQVSQSSRICYAAYTLAYWVDKCKEEKCKFRPRIAYNADDLPMEIAQKPNYPKYIPGKVCTHRYQPCKHNRRDQGTMWSYFCPKKMCTQVYHKIKRKMVVRYAAPCLHKRWMIKEVWISFPHSCSCKSVNLFQCNRFLNCRREQQQSPAVPAVPQPPVVPHVPAAPQPPVVPYLPNPPPGPQDPYFPNPYNDPNAYPYHPYDPYNPNPNNNPYIYPSL